MNDFKGGFTYVNLKLKENFKPTEITKTGITKTEFTSIRQMYPVLKK